MATLEIAKEVAVQKQPGKQQSVSGTTLPIQTGIMVINLTECLCTYLVAFEFNRELIATATFIPKELNSHTSSSFRRVMMSMAKSMNFKLFR